MLIRRCAVLFIEPREALDFDLATLFAGESALAASVRWVALAPHVGQELEVSAEEMTVLGTLGETLWVERESYDRRYGQDLIERLLTRGLLIGYGPEYAAWRERDETLRAAHWRPLSAVAHAFSRWEGMRADIDPQLSRFADIGEMVAAYGPPPPETIERGLPEAAIALPQPESAPLDEALFRRYTGRNYDPQAVLPLDLASRLLQRTFGAQHRLELAPGTVALKKTSPSGGSLHPIEAYVLVQRVGGLATGLYHYHPVRHALEPLQSLEPEAARQLALEMVAGQDWFADAPMLVILAARVARNFWKYRNHEKAYRVLLLDAGHLSQTFYLLAGETRLPAFITAAVNEADIERALGLDPLQNAVLAVCGCGEAAQERKTVEFRYGD